MPGKVKVKIISGRNLPVMDRSSDTTDAYVEIKLGTTTYKTDVCRKSLHPQWNSEWYRFELDDAELQDEPLQIRLMDHDTYSANDAIGKVYLDLNPLLLPATSLLGKWNDGGNSSHEGNNSVMSGWIPVYDTMHGIRGEVNVVVKVELFTDFNKFRQSSCGVQFFCSPAIPHGFYAQIIHGFVEELVVNDDPEYQWIDKIRTPRASNEARQTLFCKLSGELQRRIGLKAIEMGGNAVIGYNQCFDLEGESGIVARGIGTAVTLVKLDLPSPSSNVDSNANDERVQSYLKFLGSAKGFYLNNDTNSINDRLKTPLHTVPLPSPTASFRSLKIENRVFRPEKMPQYLTRHLSDREFDYPMRIGPEVTMHHSVSLQTLLKQEDQRGRSGYGISQRFRNLRFTSQSMITRKMSALKAKLSTDDEADGKRPLMKYRRTQSDNTGMAEILVRSVFHATTSLDCIAESPKLGSDDESKDHPFLTLEVPIKTITSSPTSSRMSARSTSSVDDDDDDEDDDDEEDEEDNGDIIGELDTVSHIVETVRKLSMLQSPIDPGDLEYDENKFMFVIGDSKDQPDVTFVGDMEEGNLLYYQDDIEDKEFETNSFLPQFVRSFDFMRKSATATSLSTAVDLLPNEDKRQLNKKFTSLHNIHASESRWNKYSAHGGKETVLGELFRRIDSAHLLSETELSDYSPDRSLGSMGRSGEVLVDNCLVMEEAASKDSCKTECELKGLKRTKPLKLFMVHHGEEITFDKEDKMVETKSTTSLDSKQESKPKSKGLKKKVLKVLHKLDSKIHHKKRKSNPKKFQLTSSDSKNNQTKQPSRDVTHQIEKSGLVDSPTLSHLSEDASQNFSGSDEHKHGLLHKLKHVPRNLIHRIDTKIHEVHNHSDKGATKNEHGLLNIAHGNVLMDSVQDVLVISHTASPNNCSPEFPIIQNDVPLSPYSKESRQDCPSSNDITHKSKGETLDNHKHGILDKLKESKDKLLHGHLIHKLDNTIHHLGHHEEKSGIRDEHGLLHIALGNVLMDSVQEVLVTSHTASPNDCPPEFPMMQSDAPAILLDVSPGSPHIVDCSQSQDIDAVITNTGEQLDNHKHGIFDKIKESKDKILHINLIHKLDSTIHQIGHHEEKCGIRNEHGLLNIALGNVLMDSVQEVLATSHSASPNANRPEFPVAHSPEFPLTTSERPHFTLPHLGRQGSHSHVLGLDRKDSQYTPSGFDIEEEHVEVSESLHEKNGKIFELVDTTIPSNTENAPVTAQNHSQESVRVVPKINPLRLDRTDEKLSSELHQKKDNIPLQDSMFRHGLLDKLKESKEKLRHHPKDLFLRRDSKLQSAPCSPKSPTPSSNAESLQTSQNTSDENVTQGGKDKKVGLLGLLKEGKDKLFHAPKELFHRLDSKIHEEKAEINNEHDLINVALGNVLMDSVQEVLATTHSASPKSQPQTSEFTFTTLERAHPKLPELGRQGSHSDVLDLKNEPAYMPTEPEILEDNGPEDDPSLLDDPTGLKSQHFDRSTKNVTPSEVIQDELLESVESSKSNSETSNIENQPQLPSQLLILPQLNTPITFNTCLDGSNIQFPEASDKVININNANMLATGVNTRIDTGLHNSINTTHACLTTPRNVETPTPTTITNTVNTTTTTVPVSAATSIESSSRTENGHQRTESLGVRISHSPAKINAIPCIHRRSSDSDLSITPKGNSLTGSDRSGGYSSGQYMRGAMLRTTRPQENFDIMEYPFLTLSKYPGGFIAHIGGSVSARSVKLLERISNLEEPESRDTWWSEIRMEIRSHARALNCNAVLGYTESTSICDDVCVLSASGTAAVLCLQHHSTAEASDNVGGLPVLPKTNTNTITTMTTSLDRNDFEKDKEKEKEKTKVEDKPTTSAGTSNSNISSKAKMVPVNGNSGNANTSPERETQNVKSSCSLSHLPYTSNSKPLRSSSIKCYTCGVHKVPDMLIATIEMPDGMPNFGRGCFIQSYVCRPLKDLKGESNAKEISDGLPFLEYELHRFLINKLKVKGMNAIFGLKVRISIGERMLIGIATGTAVFLSSLPPPLLPKLVSDRTTDEKKLTQLQKNLHDTIKKNREIYQLCAIEEVNGETGKLPLESDDSEEEMATLDLAMGNKDCCILEVDDPDDVDVLNSLMEPRPPDGFHVVNTEHVPGLEDLEIVKNLQMFTQIWRAKIPAPFNLDKHFHRLLQSVYFKLRRMIPCALCDLQFRVDSPEPDEIQLCVLGMALGLGDPFKGQKKRKIVIPKRNDDELIFNLEEDQIPEHSVVQTPSTHLLQAQSLKHRQKSPIRNKLTKQRHMPYRERHGVDITPLSYVPGGKIEKYLGNLNFFLIRETTSLREEGGLSGFIHSFVTEILAIVRAHVTALGGNAMVAYFITECVLNHNLHKNQGQCLINVGGDVVYVSYFTEDH